MLQPYFTRRLSLLTDRYFVLGLCCLLINDFILKYQLGNFITGKLSDFAGLFIFPFFWSVFFVNHQRKIYWVTGFFFILWKTPVSTDFLGGINQTFGTGFSRVIDYTDLAALMVLPISYRYLKRIETTVDNKPFFLPLPILISLVSLFAFVATSLPSERIEKNSFIGASYTIDMGKETIFQDRMRAINAAHDSLELNMADSLFYLHYYAGRHDFLAVVKIARIDAANTRIVFDSLKSFTITGRLFRGIDEEDIKAAEHYTADDFKKFFKVGVIEKIKNKRENPTDVFYWNPRFDPQRTIVNNK